MTRREIKKLKAVEIKREPFKKLDNHSNKKSEEKKEDSKENSDFKEKILEESIDFAAPVIKSDEEKKTNKEEKIENLEEFASALPSTTPSSDENPYSNKTNYANTSGSGSYDSDNRYDSAERYSANADFQQNNVPDALRTDNANPFKTPTFGNQVDERGKEGLTANRLEESARITQQYRNERETANRESLPHQTKSKREIF